MGQIDVCTWNGLEGREAYTPVYHHVPLIPQPDDGTCWAASAAALTGKINTLGHCTVIVGVRGDNDPVGMGTALHIQDPLLVGVGSCYSITYFEWMKQLARTYGVFRLQRV
jgi:hypothetical protein